MHRNAPSRIKDITLIIDKSNKRRYFYYIDIGVNKQMNYEWDSAKNTTNQEKHGLSFDAMDRFDWTFALCVETQVVDHEERELWIARLT